MSPSTRSTWSTRCVGSSTTRAARSGCVDSRCRPRAPDSLRAGQRVAKAGRLLIPQGQRDRVLERQLQTSRVDGVGLRAERRRRWPERDGPGGQATHRHSLRRDGALGHVRCAARLVPPRPQLSGRAKSRRHEPLGRVRFPPTLRPSTRRSSGHIRRRRAPRPRSGPATARGRRCAGRCLGSAGDEVPGQDGAPAPRPASHGRAIFERPASVARSGHAVRRASCRGDLPPRRPPTTFGPS
jgi:hypothetical protein